jgi:ABC-type uncharacterized transport system substrate-binding protein
MLLVVRYVDRIFKAQNPADLSVERAATFELAISLKTAKVLDLAIPPLESPWLGTLASPAGLTRQQLAAFRLSIERAPS